MCILYPPPTHKAIKEIWAANLRSKLVQRKGWKEEMGENDIIVILISKSEKDKNSHSRTLNSCDGKPT